MGSANQNAIFYFGPDAANEHTCSLARMISSISLPRNSSSNFNRSSNGLELKHLLVSHLLVQHSSVVVNKQALRLASV